LNLLEVLVPAEGFDPPDYKSGNIVFLRSLKFLGFA